MSLFLLDTFFYRLLKYLKNHISKNWIGFFSHETYFKLQDYNKDQKVKDFIKAAVNWADAYDTNHILMTMGEDFNYNNANVWFKNLDKLIKYVNGSIVGVGKKMNIFYSTPSCYLKAINDVGKTWPIKTDDFFPYASDPHAYWTGYFTSRYLI